MNNKNYYFVINEDLTSIKGVFEDLIDVANSYIFNRDIKLREGIESNIILKGNIDNRVDYEYVFIINWNDFNKFISIREKELYPNTGKIYSIAVSGFDFRVEKFIKLIQSKFFLKLKIQQLIEQ